MDTLRRVIERTNVKTRLTTLLFPPSPSLRRFQFARLLRSRRNWKFQEEFRASGLGWSQRSTRIFHAETSHRIPASFVSREWLRHGKKTKKKKNRKHSELDEVRTSRFVASNCAMQTSSSEEPVCFKAMAKALSSQKVREQHSWSGS